MTWQKEVKTQIKIISLRFVSLKNISLQFLWSWVSVNLCGTATSDDTMWSGCRVKGIWIAQCPEPLEKAHSKLLMWVRWFLHRQVHLLCITEEYWDSMWPYFHISWNKLGWCRRGAKVWVQQFMLCLKGTSCEGMDSDRDYPCMVFQFVWFLRWHFLSSISNFFKVQHLGWETCVKQLH